MFSSNDLSDEAFIDDEEWEKEVPRPSISCFTRETSKFLWKLSVPPEDPPPDPVADIDAVKKTPEFHRTAINSKLLEAYFMLVGVDLSIKASVRKTGIVHIDIIDKRHDYDGKEIPQVLDFIKELNDPAFTVRTRKSFGMVIDGPVETVEFTDLIMSKLETVKHAPERPNKLKIKIPTKGLFSGR
ncbi:MAG: hypothetical protein PHE27_03715 [Alphaproteobacteria bacterium]|nr:hypothetical protein [Alphaproteobacteria bacterium]